MIQWVGMLGEVVVVVVAAAMVEQVHGVFVGAQGGRASLSARLLTVTTDSVIFSLHPAL